MNRWQATLDDRQNALIRDCQRYASGDAAGLPGHNLMIIISKMAQLLDQAQIIFESHFDDAGDLRQPATEATTPDGSAADKRA